MRKRQVEADLAALRTEVLPYEDIARRIHQTVGELALGGQSFDATFALAVRSVSEQTQRDAALTVFHSLTPAQQWEQLTKVYGGSEGTNILEEVLAAERSLAVESAKRKRDKLQVQRVCAEGKLEIDALRPGQKITLKLFDVRVPELFYGHKECVARTLEAWALEGDENMVVLTADKITPKPSEEVGDEIAYKEYIMRKEMPTPIPAPQQGTLGTLLSPETNTLLPTIFNGGNVSFSPLLPTKENPIVNLDYYVGGLAIDDTRVWPVVAIPY